MEPDKVRIRVHQYITRTYSKFTNNVPDVDFGFAPKMVIKNFLI